MAKPVFSALFMYNSRFEPNVDRLERLYKNRFDRRHHIMPFAKVKRPEVIRVAETGWYFHGHLAQAARQLDEPDVTHYVLISDDLVLNPRLDQSNLLEALQIDRQTAWIKSLATADELRFSWNWAAGGACQMQRMRGQDTFAMLPPAEEARALMERHGLSFGRPVPKSLNDWNFLLCTVRRQSRFLWLDGLTMFGRSGPYPLAVGYADFLILPAHAFRQFIDLIEIFAALNLFVEMAIPTALAMIYDRIATELEIGQGFRDPAARRRGDAPLKGIELANGNAFADGLGRSMERLTTDFPDDWLYAHPVKLSQWRWADDTA